ncbi:hypothetical protein mRhiFer1_009568 [Rhinolophus ferrumequinum]|uniref:non-specific serine/threonine protein kinase n=1 Tax=Rhinolophus ferrumequinum TaxID=59479 RepID=A0A7J7ZQP7_RHIFE|nr:hypothetical protein mRhiFer1_009568 [Rhinolophus ferrumequinum]
MLHDFTDIPVDQEPHSAHYELQGNILKGSYGKVVLGKHILTERKVAVKIIHQEVSDRTHRSLLHEVRCMEVLHHPDIVQLFHVISMVESLILVMELMPGGDMLDYLHDHGLMSEDKAHRVFQQLVSAVHYCHKKGIAHRDLKPENVLLDTRMNVNLQTLDLEHPSMSINSARFVAVPCMQPQNYSWAKHMMDVSQTSGA